jgi:hypothetical protein
MDEDRNDDDFGTGKDRNAKERKGKARIGPPGFPFDPFGNSMALLQISNHSN